MRDLFNVMNAQCLIDMMWSDCRRRYRTGISCSSSFSETTHNKIQAWLHMNNARTAASQMAYRYVDQLEKATN